MRYQPESLVLPGKNHGTEKSDSYTHREPLYNREKLVNHPILRSDGWLADK
jgi:hypothetical protein